MEGGGEEVRRGEGREKREKGRDGKNKGSFIIKPPQ